MPSAHVWTGQEVHQLDQFRLILSAASRLVGHDDYLANLLLEDALEALECVLGNQAAAVRGPRAETR